MDTQSSQYTRDASGGKVMTVIRRILLGRKQDSLGEEEEQLWPTLIEKSMKEWRDQVDETEINRMLKNFDPEHILLFGGDTTSKQE